MGTLQKVGVIGAGGLIGSRIVKFLEFGYEVVVVKSTYLYESSEQLANRLHGLDIVVNLAGYPVSGRWNKKIKRLIYDSRVPTTHNLVMAIGLMKRKPTHLINASAVGIYGDFQLCDETSKHLASNYLSTVVSDWEKEASIVRTYGVNLTILRFGVVLSRSGGAYPLLRKIFKMGLGGRLGNGKQGFSFVLIDDLAKIFDFVIEKKIYGIVNAVAPEPTTNKLLSRELSIVLNRPNLFSLPAFILKLLYGEGSSTLLHGQRVNPGRLLENGFQFVGNNLINCLKELEK
jgi:uncharacterized protein